jgi:hypothetical protein
MKRILFLIVCISLTSAAFAETAISDKNAQLIQAAEETKWKDDIIVSFEKLTPDEDSTLNLDVVRVFKNRVWVLDTNVPPKVLESTVKLGAGKQKLIISDPESEVRVEDNKSWLIVYKTARTESIDEKEKKIERRDRILEEMTEKLLDAVGMKDARFCIRLDLPKGDPKYWVLQKRVVKENEHGGGFASESNITKTSIGFKDNTNLKVELKEFQWKADHFYVCGRGEIALKTAHLLDPNGQPEESKRKLGPTTTVLIEAEAYKAPGQLRTKDDEEMIGIQGKCFLEVHLFENEKGSLIPVENIESEGLTFKDSFKKSKVKMLGSNWTNIIEGTIVKDAGGQFKLEQKFPQREEKVGK